MKGHRNVRDAFFEQDFALFESEMIKCEHTNCIHAQMHVHKLRKCTICLDS